MSKFHISMEENLNTQMSKFIEKNLELINSSLFLNPILFEFLVLPGFRNCVNFKSHNSVQKLC